jgi:hypothetical protein
MLASMRLGGRGQESSPLIQNCSQKSPEGHRSKFEFRHQKKSLLKCGEERTLLSATYAAFNLVVHQTGGLPVNPRTWRPTRNTQIVSSLLTHRFAGAGEVVVLVHADGVI